METEPKQPTKPDVVLSNGRKLYIDLDKITNKEFSSLFQPGQTEAEEHAILFKVVGITEEEYQNLTINDTKQIWFAFFRKVKEPLENPT